MLGCGLGKLRVIRPAVLKSLLSVSISTVSTRYYCQEDMAAKTAHPLEVSRSTRNVFNNHMYNCGDIVGPSSSLFG